MEDLKRIECQIGRNSYVLISEKSEEQVLEVANYVDKKIKEAVSRNRRLNPTMTSVLASVNIADELFNIREEYENFVEENKFSIDEYPQTKNNLDEISQKYQEKIENESVLTAKIEDLELELKNTKDDLEIAVKKLKTIEDTNSKRDKDLEVLRINLEKQQRENIILAKQIQEFKRFNG